MFVLVKVVNMTVRLDFTEFLLPVSSEFMLYQSLQLKASFFPLSSPAAIIPEGLQETDREAIFLSKHYGISGLWQG